MLVDLYSFLRDIGPTLVDIGIGLAAYRLGTKLVGRVNALDETAKEHDKRLKLLEAA